MSSLDNATPGGIITGLAQLQMHHTIFLKRKMGYSSDKAKQTGINDEVKEKTNKQLDRKEENQPFDDPRRRRRPICELPKYLKKTWTSGA